MKYDVLIVGAGVTGALLFLALKNKNINTYQKSIRAKDKSF